MRSAHGTRTKAADSGQTVSTNQAVGLASAVGLSMKS